IRASAQSTREQAVVEFQDKTLVAGVVLQGKYLVVHDEALSAKGEPCFRVYQYVEGKEAAAAQSEKPVVAFHCQPVDRKKATDLVTTVGMSEGGLLVLREIQFAGSEKGHKIPEA
ncbi:MAG: hypothetical protein ACREDR_06075, partial [Blastocatellia bacterium]